VEIKEAETIKKYAWNTRSNTADDESTTLFLKKEAYSRRLVSISDDVYIQYKHGFINRCHLLVGIYI